MIYSTDASKIFSKAQYNKGFQAALEQYYGASALTQNFTKTIDATDSNPATPINYLNLNKLYIIAFSLSAQQFPYRLEKLNATDYIKAVE